MREADLVKPVQKFVSELEKAGGKPLYELTPQEARQVLREIQKDEGVKPEAKIEDKSAVGQRQGNAGADCQTCGC
ncbi:MAG: hypothetical protein ACLT2E_02365 [Alphaproteobacteria bacterium]